MLVKGVKSLLIKYTTRKVKNYFWSHRMVDWSKKWGNEFSMKLTSGNIPQFDKMFTLVPCKLLLKFLRIFKQKIFVLLFEKDIDDSGQSGRLSFNIMFDHIVVLAKVILKSKFWMVAAVSLVFPQRNFMIFSFMESSWVENKSRTHIV